jgi:hypothetical protein
VGARVSLRRHIVDAAVVGLPTACGLSTFRVMMRRIFHDRKLDNKIFLL